MYKCRAVLSLLIICSLKAVSKLIYINEPDTWYSAIETCRSVYNGTLATFNMTSVEEQHLNKSIWNGRYQMTSSWLTIEGCYERPTEVIEFHSDDMSIAMCSQFCSNKKYFYFAVQGEHCDCLTNITISNTISNTSRYNVSNECFNTEVQASEMVLVYGIRYTGDLGFSEDTTLRCLSARCTNGTPELIPANCNESLYYICGNTHSNSNATWDQAKEACITNNQSHLIRPGDLGICTVGKQLGGIFWVDSRRYHGNADDQYPLLPDPNAISACTYIVYHGNKSTLSQEWTSDCFNSSRKNSFFCKSEFDQTLSSSNAPSTETTTTLQEHRDKALETGIVIGGVIGGVAVTIIGIVVLVILLKRKRLQPLHHKTSIQLKLDSRNSDIQRSLGIDVLNNRLSDTAKTRDSDRIFTVENESSDLKYRQNTDLNRDSYKDDQNDNNK